MSGGAGSVGAAFLPADGRRPDLGAALCGLGVGGRTSRGSGGLAGCGPRPLHSEGENGPRRVAVESGWQSSVAYPALTLQCGCWHAP